MLPIKTEAFINICIEERKRVICLCFRLFGGLRESAVDVSFFVGAAKGVPVYVRGKGLQLLEEAVVVGQYKDVADGCFFFDEAYVMFRWKQVGFGDLVSSAYLASCVLRRKLQAGGKLETFLCGGVVEFPGDFRQAFGRCGGSLVYSQFGDMEMLVGVERHLKVESDRFAIREESKGFSDDVLTGYFQFPFQ